MIRKGTKKVIPYNNDYEPTKIAKGDKVIFDYEKKTASGKEVSIVSDYKPKPYLEVNGDDTQNTDKVPVLSVEGKAEIVDGNILGAGEYLSNQLFDYTKVKSTDTINGITLVNNNDGTFTANGTATDNTWALLNFTPKTQIKSGDKYLLNQLGDSSTYFLGDNSGKINSYTYSGIRTIDSSDVSIRFNVRQGITLNNFTFPVIFHNLTELGLQDLTLDQLKAQHPDLFVPQPYHTTEKRIGMIFNDGSVDRLDYKKVKVKDLSWAKDAYGNMAVQIADMEQGISGDLPNISLKGYETVIYNNRLSYTTPCITVGNNTSSIQVRNSGFDNATDFKNSFNDNDYLEYKLANPQPLYAVNDIKDEYKTNGVVNRNVVKINLNGSESGWYQFGNNVAIHLENELANTVLFTQNNAKNYCISNYQISNYTSSNDKTIALHNQNTVKWLVLNKNMNVSDIQSYLLNNPIEIICQLATPTTELREPISESRFDTINSIVNEDFTSDEEDTPSPSYPREIEHTSKFKWNDLELPLDLYNGDKIIASRKVGKNLLGGIVYVNIGGSYIVRDVHLEENKTYTISCENSLNAIYVQNNTNTQTLFSKYNAKSLTFTPTSSGYYSFNFDRNNAQTTSQFQLELGSTATEYEPYLKDKVWKYQVKGSAKLKDLNFSYDSTTYAYPYFISTISPTPLGSQLNALSNKYKCTTFSNIANVSGYDLHFAFTGAGQLRIRHEEMKTVNSFKNSFTDNDIIVYELANPQWIDITETHSQLLHDLTPNATQEISVDNGQVKVDYYNAKE